jgi:hypothetical protein
MTVRSGEYPVFAQGYDRSLSDAPVLLDGMEVLFDRTVGLYPVNLDGSGPTENADASGSSAAA